MEVEGGGGQGRGCVVKLGMNLQCRARGQRKEDERSEALGSVMHSWVSRAFRNAALFTIGQSLPLRFQSDPEMMQYVSGDQTQLLRML